MGEGYYGGGEESQRRGRVLSLLRMRGENSGMRNGGILGEYSPGISFLGFHLSNFTFSLFFAIRIQNHSFFKI